MEGDDLQLSGSLIRASEWPELTFLKRPPGRKGIRSTRHVWDEREGRFFLIFCGG